MMDEVFAAFGALGWRATVPDRVCLLEAHSPPAFRLTADGLSWAGWSGPVPKAAAVPLQRLQVARLTGPDSPASLFFSLPCSTYSLLGRELLRERAQGV